MQPVHEVPDSATSIPRCHTFILDSSFKDESITNDDVINTAAGIGADAAVLADVYHQPYETIEALETGLTLISEHTYDCTAVLPIQPPMKHSLDGLARSTIDPTEHIIAIGGLKDAPVNTKVTAAQTVRERLGADVTIHGLGFGVTTGLAVALQNQPHLLDSIDSATLIQKNQSAGPPGDGRMLSAAAATNAQLIHDLRLLSPLADTTDEQSAITDYE